MNNPYEKLLGTPSESMARNDPTDRLCQKVMQKIERREFGRMRRRSFVFGVIVIAATAALIPAFQYFGRAAAASGLVQYLSLIASDGSYALSHWKDFLLSITDALPITAFMAIVALALVCLSALRWFMRYQTSLSVHQSHLDSMRMA